MKTYAPKTKGLAADVILEEAVKKAVDAIRGVTQERTEAGRVVWSYQTYRRDEVVAMLRAAGESAELLLSERAS